MKDIKNIQVFEKISASSEESILKLGSISYLNKKEVLFYEKNKVENVYFLLSGKVSIYKMNEFGERKVIFILNKGDMINEILIANDTTVVSCEAFEKSKILKINKKDFLNIMEKDFSLVKNILDVSEKRNRRLYRQLKNSTYMKIEKRLAAKLYRINREFGTKDGDWWLLDLKITLTYLADMLGCKRETLSRAMKLLQSKDLVKIDGKKIYIKPEKVSEFFKN